MRFDLYHFCQIFMGSLKTGVGRIVGRNEPREVRQRCLILRWFDELASDGLVSTSPREVRQDAELMINCIGLRRLKP